jgi:hypothetical protein
MEYYKGCRPPKPNEPTEIGAHPTLPSHGWALHVKPIEPRATLTEPRFSKWLNTVAISKMTKHF